jgi:RNA-binding protein Nova
MRGSGYSDSVTTEVVAALGILAKYGVLGIGVGLSNGAHTTPLSFLGVQTIDQSANAAAAAATGVYGAIGQVNLDSYIHGTGEQIRRPENINYILTERSVTSSRYDHATYVH